jgi:extradiol dioxygenase family protein
MRPFHLALPAYDLDETRRFYADTLGLTQKRSAINWVDFDFFGHQLSLHLVGGKLGRAESTLIDNDQVPARHFGLICSKEEWESLRERLSGLKQRFIIGPKIRFAGKHGEQGTFFLTDPSGNYLEFKYFTDTTEGPWY